MFLQVGNLVETSQNPDVEVEKWTPCIDSNFTLQERISLRNNMALEIGNKSKSDETNNKGLLA